MNINNWNVFPFADEIKNILKDDTLNVYVNDKYSYWLIYIKVFQTHSKSNLLYEFEFERFDQVINWDRSFL